MNMVIGVGFGYAAVTKDTEVVYMEPTQSDEGYTSPTLAEFEAMAAADPDHDWQVELVAPLRDRTYQRHDVGRWVLVRSGRGFA